MRHHNVNVWQLKKPYARKFLSLFLDFITFNDDYDMLVCFRVLVRLLDQA